MIETLFAYAVKYKLVNRITYFTTLFKALNKHNLMRVLVWIRKWFIRPNVDLPVPPLEQLYTVLQDTLLFHHECRQDYTKKGTLDSLSDYTHLVTLTRDRLEWQYLKFLDEYDISETDIKSIEAELSLANRLILAEFKQDHRYWK